MSRFPRPRALAPVLVALAVLLAGCSAGYRPTDVPYRPTPAQRGGGLTQECSNPGRSFDPSELPPAGQVPSNSSMGRVADRGRLIVGVSSDTLTMASRDARTGDITGFEIDLARGIAEAILGPGAKLDLRVVTPADALAQIDGGEIDLVIDQVAMDCAAWNGAAVSAPYLSTDHAAIERPGVSPSADAAERRSVCTPAGTAIDAWIGSQAPSRPRVTGRTWSDCLMKFQRGEADSLVAPRPIARGLAAQDPYAEVGPEPWIPISFAVLAPKQNRDMIRFVNAVLAQRVSSGEWQRSYDRWVRPYAGDGRPPQPQYGRAA
ncbi:hypothetical protein CGZ95_02025 [Enemella evansiae]|uniref:transporter substrate-binding domain-containing protein n=1 Tax=Enemella evansiae TaxID=2016499 RepID=UPI000B95F84A|nr:transporter substrate-binding domain-containing protein [Enemella evansiae]OYO05095.1 hypothetical protein CGZ95_02025 [Enemella evansiae]